MNKTICGKVLDTLAERNINKTRQAWVNLLPQFCFVWRSNTPQANDKLNTRNAKGNLLQLKLYRPLLCPAEIKGKSVTDHQQDT